MANRYRVGLKLSGFVNSKIIDLPNEEDGGYQKGIFIPFEENFIRLTDKNAVYANLVSFPCSYAGRKSHILRPAFNDEVRDYLESKGFHVSTVGFFEPIG